MVSISHSVEVPREAIDDWLEQFTGAADLVEALQRLVAQGPPSGPVEETRQSVAWEAENAPLSSIFPRVRVTHQGLPAWRPSTPEEEQDEKHARHEMLRLQVYGPLLAEALRRAVETFGVDEPSICAALTAEPFVSAPVARSVAGGLRHYAAGDWEAAQCVVAPRIETVARSLALAAGVALWRTQQGHSQGQYPGLGALLGELRKAGLDESWYRFLWTYLASPAGANHRNELAHGLLDNFDPVNATLLIFAVLFLISVARYAHSQADTTADDVPDPPAEAS